MYTVKELALMGGSVWKKDDMFRIYLSGNVLAKMINLKIKRVKKRKQCFTVMDGRGISNSQANEIFQTRGRAYFDVRTKLFSGLPEIVRKTLDCESKKWEK